MKQLSVLTAISVILGLSGCGAGKEPNAANHVPEVGGETSVKLKETFAAGDVLHITDERSSEVTTQEADPTGKVLKDERIKGRQTLIFTRTVLAVSDKSKFPTQMRQEYERAEKTDNEKTVQFGIHGKTVIIEKKDGRWQSRYEDGEELDLKDALVVSPQDEGGIEMFNELLLPKTPVNVGAPWALDVAVARRMEQASFLFRLDTEKFVGTGKLARVYRQDGHQFGFLEFTMDMPIANTNTEKGSRQATKITIDGCVDGTSHTGTMTMEQNTNIIQPATAEKPRFMMDNRINLRLVRKELVSGKAK
jgi:hypothetical protein